MCGICGIIGPPSSANKERVAAMMRRMTHRGPDGDGLWQSADERVTLGHVRLSIVDTSDAGAQPMHHPAGLHSIVNGEIYNYNDLKSSLPPKTSYQSECDSEIILHGFHQQKERFIKSLNGMFAFALYDDNEQRIWLARDRLGIKPLYYTIIGNDLLFASEIKALFGGIDADSWEIDQAGLSEYLSYQSPLGDNTLFKNIKQLVPGTYLTLNTKDVSAYKSTAYWSPKRTPRNDIGFDEAADLFSRIFDRSVKRHLLSDVPVTSYLSSGLDSASIFASASRHYQTDSHQKMSAYTGIFPDAGPWYDETGPAAELVSSEGDAHHKIAINAQSLDSELDNVINALDEPRMGMGAFSQYMVAQAAAKNYKVILAGHGGDELFSGYPVFLYAHRGILGLRKASEIPHFGYFFLSDLASSRNRQAGYKLPVLWSSKQQEMLSNGVLSNQMPWQQLQQWSATQETISDKTFMLYLQAYLPGLLGVEDKISMAHSLETRTPLLDNDLIDLSLSLPDSIKLQGRQLKALIAKNGKTLLPDSYFHQPKRGFPTPLRLWLRGELKEFIYDNLATPNAPLSSIFNPQLIARFMQNYYKSPKRFIRPLDEIQSHQMWQLISLNSWLKTWSKKYGVTLRLS